MAKLSSKMAGPELSVSMGPQGFEPWIFAV